MKRHTGMEAHDGYVPHSHEVRQDHEGVKMEEKYTLAELKKAQKDLNGYSLDELDRIAEQAKKNRAYENRTPVWKVTVPVTKLVTTSMGEQGAVSILKTELGMRGYTTGEGTATR